MKSFYPAPNSDSFRLTKKYESIERGILGAIQSEELVKSFYFAPHNDSFRLTKKNESIETEILNTGTQTPELANDVTGVNKNKRDFLKVLGVAGLGLAGTVLFPKKAEALILGGTPTSSVVGVKNVANTRINPATEATVATLATEATVTTLLKPTDLEFDTSGHLKVNIQDYTDSTETTLQTIAFGGKKYALRLATVGSIDYVGEADIGTAITAASWRIKRVNSASGIIIMWAGTTAVNAGGFDYIWDNYATLNYF